MSPTVTLRRDLRVMSLVGFAHGLSHFYQLALPPLFPLIHAADGLSFIELGSLTMAMYLASAILQPPAGFLVDRFGARRVLLCGLAVQAAATAALGLVSGYPALFAVSMLVGVGNSVFHPCDYSVMSATVSHDRMGRAYSVHNFLGYMGYAVAPVVMADAGELLGWRTAMIGAGLAGFVGLAVLALGSGDFRDSRHERAERPAGAPAPADGVAATLLQPSILFCWLFFLLVAMAQVGLQAKGIAILNLPTTWGIDLETAGVIVTLFLVCIPIGVLFGGALADRTRRHDLVVGLGYGAGAALMLLLWAAPLGTWAVGAIFAACGFLFGLAYPSRDMVVRKSTPRGASGKVFGFVYSGMDCGAFSVPVLFGWFIDIGIPREAFLFVAVTWFASIFALMATRMTTRRRDLATLSTG